MSNEQAIQFLCAQAAVRYEHMTLVEQRSFLCAVMIVAGAPEAELAARTLAALDEAEAKQGELFAVFAASRAAKYPTFP